MRSFAILAFTAVASAILAGTASADHPTAGFGYGIAGPVITVPAETLPRGMWAVGSRLEVVAFDAFSDEELEAAALDGEAVHSTDRLVSPSISAGYGLTDDLTLGVRLPYVRRSGIREAHLHEGSPEIHDHGDSDGIGDVALLGQYRILRAGGGLQASLLAGVRLPTGREDATDEDGEEFETEHQPGSGSTDPMIGLAGSRPWGGVSLDGNVLATLSGEGSQETNLGRLVNYNVAVSFRPGAAQEREHEHAHDTPPHEHAHDAPRDDPGHRRTTLDLVLEANGEWRAKAKVAGEEEENTGGHLFYISPGARLGYAGRWTVSGSVGIPVVQELNGAQHETSARILFGIGASF